MPIHTRDQWRQPGEPVAVPSHILDQIRKDLVGYCEKKGIPLTEPRWPDEGNKIPDGTVYVIVQWGGFDMAVYEYKGDHFMRREVFLNDPRQARPRRSRGK